MCGMFIILKLHICWLSRIFFSWGSHKIKNIAHIELHRCLIHLFTGVVTINMSTVPYNITWQRDPSSANYPVVMLLQIYAHSNSTFSENVVAAFLENLGPTIVRDHSPRYHALSLSCSRLRETRNHVYFVLRIRFLPIPQELISERGHHWQVGDDDSDSSSSLEDILSSIDPNSGAAAAWSLSSLGLAFWDKLIFDIYS